MIEEAKLKYQELAAKKRAELESAIEKGEVKDPISILIAVGVSAALSSASYVVSRAFAPKPQRQQIGKLSGSIQLQNSEQGLFIPEIYGAGPTASIVAGSSPTWQNLTNTTGGAGGALTKTSGAANNYNAGASHNVAVSTGNAFLKVTRGTGHAAAGFFSTASPTGSGTSATGLVFGVAWEPGDGGLYPVINGVGPPSGAAIDHTSVGDVFTIEIRSGRFYLYKNSAEITEFSSPYPTPSYPLYMGVIMYTSGAGVSNTKVQIGSIGDAPNEGKGGIKVPAIIVWSSGIRKTVTVTQEPTGGSKGGGGGGTPTENITYDIDLGLLGPRGPVDLLRWYANADVLIDQTPTSTLLTGIYNPATGADTTYDPTAPPNPAINYTLPIDRVNKTIALDGDGVGTGVIQGGGTPFAIYPGNDTQQPDPTIEADIDGRYGTGSTPAYRNHALGVLTNLQLSRWGGIVPNMTFVWQHQTLKTLDAIFASLCERVSLTGDLVYDPVTWQNMANVSQSGADNKLTKTSGSGSAFDAGASSVETASGDCELEWDLLSHDACMVGLSVSDPNLDFESILYAIYSNGTIYESGATQAAPSISYPTTGKIKRVGTTITYYIGGSLVYTSLIPSTGALRIDVSMHNFGGIVGGVTLTAELGSDYDFSNLSTIASRGMLIAGRLFSPAEVIGSPEIQTVYNYFVTEAEGQIKGFIEGAEPSITIADTEIGWMDSDSDVSDILPEVDTIIASEISLPRQVDIKYIDPDNDWDVNTQSDNRQITEGVSTEVLEVQLALLASEARAAAQRKLYQGYVAGSAHKFTLSWKYMYLYPGYKITITRAEGFSHVLKLTSMTGGIGVLDCEGIALEPAAFTQPANSDRPPGWIPPQSIPAMTVVSLLDTPLLREGDETNYNGVGFYACGVPRTGVNQNWQGFSLYGLFYNSYVFLQSFNLPATVGTIVSATGLSSDTSVVDRAGKFTVDLYGITAALTSITEAELLSVANINLAVVANMVIQFATATQLTPTLEAPNRWELTTLLNGQRGTERRITETFTGKRFILVNQAVKFVPMEIADIGSNRSYRAVTVGQSLGDAATVSFAWTAETLKCLTPVNLRGTRNSIGDLFSAWTRRSRFGAGMIPGSDVPLGEELEQYDVQFLTTADVVKRDWFRVIPGGAQAAILLPLAPRYAASVSGNNITGSVGGVPQFAYTKQQIASNGGWVEATLGMIGATQTSLSMDLRSEINLDAPPSGYYSVTFNTFTTSGGGRFEIYSDAGWLFTSAEYPGLRSARVRVVVVGSEVRFYWDYLGPGSIPVYVSALPALLPLTPMFTIIDGTKATNIFVGSNINGPSVIYSAEQQVADGFIPNVSVIRQRVAQVSAIVGRGPYIQADF